ncbi:PREDICTED: HD domain-containing protein 2-like [Priapulus caudatus]|uniref:5'-deoxynucleotidase HDDC2 n=1 Tax=Priapulus caudatus TaxID=37621 RepID=A0ABM1EWU3_PRICU|nr:PREDICTED: HD domain-containing protein 2-like [Priapulus caudatus]
MSESGTGTGTASATASASSSSSNRKTTNVTNVLEFMMLVGQLKRVKRAGWIIKEVRDVESVADHMYRMAIMSMLLDCRHHLDKSKCIKLSLVHDLAEAIVGDLTPHDNVEKAEKHLQEMRAMQHACSLLDKEPSEEIYSLWEEYEAQETPEARVVKDLDRFDMVLQAYEYERLEDRPGELQDFYRSTQGSFKHPDVIAWMSELHRLRGEFPAAEKSGD